MGDKVSETQLEDPRERPGLSARSRLVVYGGPLGG